ncbi:MAG: M48 family metalloprotease, partial [Alphaproteobacteria bacterium]|nr:M48 family metalloprotease [Alphaproteobacteria bacterium]
MSRDERVNAIAYRLQTRGAKLCPASSPQPSFFLRDVHSRVVDAVVPGSPAAEAGLRPGDAITTVAGVPADDAHAVDLLDSAFAKGRIQLGLSDGRALNFSAETGCGFSISVDHGGGLDAWADGKAVALTAKMVDFTHDDDELALIIAHELSHNIFGHKAQLDARHV